QGLDDLGGFDRHALGELADGDRRRNLDLADDGRRRSLEAVLRVAGNRDTAPAYALLLLAAPAGHAVGDVQRVVVGRGLPALHLVPAVGLGPLRRFLRGRSRRRGRGGRRGGGFRRRGSLCGRAGARGLLVRGRCRLAALFLGAPALLGLALLALEPLALLGLAPLALLPLRLETRLFLGAALGVELLLLLARLLLEHVALDIRALLPHLDVHGARAPLTAGEPDLALR